MNAIDLPHAHEEARDYVRDPDTGVWRRGEGPGIVYTDGAAFEQALLEQLRSVGDLSTTSDELAALIVDWPSEAHLSSARANLLRPLRFGPSLRVLEAGAGCGAITRYLGETGAAVDAVEGAALRAACAAQRCRDLCNVRVVRDAFTDFASTAQYDVVTLIGVLEYARLFVPGEDPVQRLLAHARARLSQHGLLVLAIENQLGLKYFNACREDHLGARYAGVTDLYGPSTAVTFGRAELGRRLAEAGFARLDWYFPFPDYKLPSTVISERALRHRWFASGELPFGEYARDYGGGVLRNFDESGVWPVLARNGLLGELANSFLVVASVDNENPLDPDSSWLAERYSVLRTRNFATRTTFVNGEGGEPLVRRRALLARQDDAAPDGPIRVTQRLGDERYVRGRSFARRFADGVARGLDAAGLAAELTPWIAYLVDRARTHPGAAPATPWSQLTLPGDLVDCTPFNLVVDDANELHAIDLEFVVEGRIPLAWVALRGVVHTATRCFGHGYLAGKTAADVVADIMPRVGFGDITDWSPYCELEDALIRAVLRPWPGRKDAGMFAERLRLPVSSVASEGQTREAAERQLLARRDEAARELQERSHEAARWQAALSAVSACVERVSQGALSAQEAAALRAELDGMLDLPAVGRFALALDSLLRQDGEHRRLADEHSRAHEQVATQASELVGLRASLAELQSELAAERARMEEAEKRIGEAAHVRAELERQIEARSNEALHHLAHVGELERAREAALIEAAALARRMGEAQERAGFEAGRVATLERELGRRRGFWRRSGVAEGSRDESDASGLSLQRASFRALRALYRRLPLDERGRARAKSLFYRSFGRIYRDQQNYQLWKALDRQPAGEAPASSAPPVASAEHSAAPAPLRLTRSVSIVIPAYGKADMTRRCIESVQRADGGAACEIVVVDDASPEPLALQLADLTHVTIVRNETNQGFIGACNRGAEVAGGSLLLFLNNDTEVRRDVITAMADTFDREPDTGLVGCKLVFPDGRLQEAGCSIDHAGNAVMIGLWDDPSRPRYNFEREVAYCSGACFMIERELFVRLGGFDPAFAPAYCEDSDLCFRVRAAGRRVVYQPRAEVLHALSASMQDSPIDKMAVIAVNQRRFLERWSGALAAEDKVRAIALYLPQYHAIAENDRWWGEGFTEWTNVSRAQPSFEGHAQPNVPASIGYYDLRLPAVRSEQARLAREAGLSGFCYYYYWFGGTRLLHEPLDAVIASGEPDFPFCVCWANENWTRRWDGLDSEILIAQQHSAEDDLAFIDSLLPALRDPRYIRVHGKPLLLVYRPALLPDAAATARRWRERVREAGLPGLYLVSVQSFFHVDSRGPNAFGFDAAAEFPPHSFAVRCPEQPRGFPGKRFEGTAYDYAKTAESFLTREMPAYKVFRGVMPRWDNTARRGVHANVFLGASPEGYRQWLQRAVDYTRQMYFGDERLVFVNAWNEWGEGNYLEPDERHGTAYLEATKSVLAAVNEART